MSTYCVIKCKREIKGPRFDTRIGETRTIRYGYMSTNLPIPRVVAQAIAGEPIDWGGIMVTSDFYDVVYHGPNCLEARKHESYRPALPAQTQQLFVRRGSQTYPVASFEDASQKWCEFRDTTGAGASEIGEDVMIYDQTGTPVARISYNGKIWPPVEWKPGLEPLYVP